MTCAPQPCLRESNVAAKVLENTLQVCGLAYTNENTAARVNAFGPLAYCECHLSAEISPVICIACEMNRMLTT